MSVAKTSPTQRTLALLRSEGWTAEKVEQRLPIPGKYVTRDLFNCIDIVAVKAGERVLGVQATSGSNVSARVEKIQKLEPVWLEVARLEVWGWRQAGPRGERKTWEVRKVVLNP